MEHANESESSKLTCGCPRWSCATFRRSIAMTLVLACLTPNAVYQVSDRRLVNPQAHDIVVDDERNKTVVFESRISFAYTGLASIKGKRTDTWLAEVIADGPSADMETVANRIRDRASEAFQSWAIPKDLKRHAFQGVGWFRLPGESDITPGIICIHNALEPSTGNWLEHPLEGFEVSSQFPSAMPGGCILNSVGVVPSSEEKSAVLRLVRKAAKREDSAPSAILRALIESMTWLSSRHKEIGKGMIVVRITKKGVVAAGNSGQHVMLAGAVDAVAPTFFYVSATGSQTYFGPHFVAGGMVVTDFQAGSL